MAFLPHDLRAWYGEGRVCGSATVGCSIATEGGHLCLPEGPQSFSASWGCQRTWDML